MEDENPLEHKEHLDELADQRSGWTRYLALSTAIVAVLAALSSLRSGDLVNEALVAKSDAVLAQSRAADQYAFFQAKGIKKSIAEQQLAAKPSEDLRQQIDRYAREQQDIKAEADRDVAEVATHEKESRRLLERHRRTAFAVTAFQIAIALAAVGALLRRKPMWFLSLAIAAAGVGFGLWGLAP